MPADPEYVARRLGKFDVEIDATRQILVRQTVERDQTEKRLKTLTDQKHEFLKDVESVKGASLDASPD